MELPNIVSLPFDLDLFNFTENRDQNIYYIDLSPNNRGNNLGLKSFCYEIDYRYYLIRQSISELRAKTDLIITAFKELKDPKLISCYMKD